MFGSSLHTLAFKKPAVTSGVFVLFPILDTDTTVKGKFFSIRIFYVLVTWLEVIEFASSFVGHEERTSINEPWKRMGLSIENRLRQRWLSNKDWRKEKSKKSQEPLWLTSIWVSVFSLHILILEPLFANFTFIMKMTLIPQAVMQQVLIILRND